MRIHYLQHASFEGINSLRPWIDAQGHSLTGTELFSGETLPELDSFDWLIIMGGPMSVHDETKHPWLIPEKAFIRAAIETGKIVLGICLGAQLIANVLGADVRKNAHREIGWFPIQRDPAIDNTELATIFPQTLDVFHWHGDTFDIPEGSLPIASSEACANQGFILGNRVIGLQCHPEATPEFAEHLLKNCRDELDGTRYVQNDKEILAPVAQFKAANLVMQALLDYLSRVSG